MNSPTPQNNRRNNAARPVRSGAKPTPRPNLRARSSAPRPAGATSRVARTATRPTRTTAGRPAAPRFRTTKVAAKTTKTPQRKVPEALPDQKVSPLEKLRDTFRKKPAIQAIVREPTSGGIVFRYTPDQTDIEILLIQDSKNRWTIPKGHIEPGETAKQTAIREIGEEAGLTHISVLAWLGKIHFKYRRLDKLVLMTTQVYLVRSLDQGETPTKEKWMHGIKWFSFADALEAIEYEDIEKLMLIAKKRIRTGEFKQG